MTSRRGIVSLGLLVPLLCLGAAVKDEPFRYTEAKHGPAELRYINELPVLTLSGMPEEIGEQAAALLSKPAAKLFDYPREFLRLYKVDATWPLFVSVGRSMVAQFPQDHRAEIESFIKASQIDRDLVVTGNTMFDTKKFIACSTLLVEAQRSATKGPLLARNLDFDTLGYLQDYSLVTVYHPKGKHAFASVGFPGLVGVLSGMNDAGLTLAVLEVFFPGHEGGFDPKGVPYAMCYRRVLEECTTVAEAEKLLRSLHRTTTTNLAICDKNGGAVFEITPKSIFVRKPEAGVCPCTNHFRSKELAGSLRCRRYAALEETGKLPTIGVDDLAKGLHAANQDWLTLQTMVFEPNELKLHLAIGPCPTSALPMKTLDLRPLLAKNSLSSRERSN
jgi:isopenicillin-N N-acyltransferase like protein